MLGALVAAAFALAVTRVDHREPEDGQALEDRWGDRLEQRHRIRVLPTRHPVRADTPR